MAWTQERVDTMRRMAAEGASYGMVAEVLKVTRNAVAGKAGREGIAFSCPYDVARKRLSDAVQKAWDRDNGTRREMARARLAERTMR
jgi:hypothetical protein